MTDVDRLRCAVCGELVGYPVIDVDVVRCSACGELIEGEPFVTVDDRLICDECRSGLSA